MSRGSSTGDPLVLDFPTQREQAVVVEHAGQQVVAQFVQAVEQVWNDRCPSQVFMARKAIADRCRAAVNPMTVSTVVLRTDWCGAMASGRQVDRPCWRVAVASNRSRVAKPVACGESRRSPAPPCAVAWGRGLWSRPGGIEPPRMAPVESSLSGMREPQNWRRRRVQQAVRHHAAPSILRRNIGTEPAPFAPSRSRRPRGRPWPAPASLTNPHRPWQGRARVCPRTPRPSTLRPLRPDFPPRYGRGGHVADDRRSSDR